MTDERFTLVGPRQTEEPPTPRRRPRRLRCWPSAAVLAVIAAGCLGCGLLMTHDPSYMDLQHVSAAPCREFLFGTDTMGRDIFSMIWYGGRISLAIGVLATAISTVIAVVLGALSGSAPVWLDNLLMRLTEILLSVPNLLLVVLIQAILGKATVWSISLVIGLTSWTSIAKVVRTEVRQLRGSEVHGRELFLHSPPPPGAEFSLVDHVYGRHERAQRDDCRVDAELYGHRPAARGDLVGQHALARGEGAADKRVVDHRDSGRVSGGDASVHDEHRPRPAPPGEPPAQQSLTGKYPRGTLGPA